MVRSCCAKVGAMDDADIGNHISGGRILHMKGLRAPARLCQLGLSGWMG